MRLQSVRWLDLVQTTAIVLGIVYGAVELTQFKDEQRRQGAAELMQLLFTPEFQEGLATLRYLPEDATAEEIEAAFKEDQSLDLLYNLAGTYESIGYLVWRGDLDLDLVDELMGGATIQAWRRFEKIATRNRENWDRAAFNEWFQWLAEKLQELPADELPAYERYREG